MAGRSDVSFTADRDGLPVERLGESLQQDANREFIATVVDFAYMRERFVNQVPVHELLRQPQYSGPNPLRYRLFHLPANNASAGPVQFN